jgi:type III restriction enzyme
MKIQFDAQQQYQLDAVAAVVDLFDGQPLQQPEYSVYTSRVTAAFSPDRCRRRLGLEIDCF